MEENAGRSKKFQEERYLVILIAREMDFIYILLKKMLYIRNIYI